MLSGLCALLAGGALAWGIVSRDWAWGIESKASAQARVARRVGVAAAAILPAFAFLEGHPWLGIMLWGAALAAAADLATREIPHRFVAVMAAAAVPAMIWQHQAVGASILTAAGVGAFFLAVHLVSRSGLGLGDVKLATAAAVTLGWPLAVSAMVLGLWAAGAFAAFLLLTRRRGRHDGIPLGPFLALGIAVAALAAVPI